MTYGYDTASRLTSVSDGTLSATYAYQANSDLLSTITLRNGATTRLTTTRVYDRWGRLQSQWAVANAASVQPVVGSGYTYNAAGQRIRQDLGDGTYWTYAYDSLGQLTGAQHRWPDGTLVAGQQYGYLYDDIGNRKQSQEGGDANGAGLQTTTYTANLLNQYSGITTPGVASVNGLANATNTVTVNGAATVRQGEYWWRETSVNNASAPVWASLSVAASNGGTTNTTVNRYVSKASETPMYDDDGNQTGDGRWIYRWDAENRLVEMETTSTATTAGVPYAKVRWTYDPLGRRIQRESWQGANPVVVTKYVYDGWQCLAELDGSNGVTATYAWGLDLSGSRTGAGGVGGLLWVNHTQHGRHFYSYDGNGNVCGLTSATDGTRTGGYEYDTFGGIIRANEAQPVAGWNEWRFSAKRMDTGAELVLYEHRISVNRNSKWLSKDPLAESGGLNLSGLISCDLINHVDIDGRQSSLDNARRSRSPLESNLYPGLRDDSYSAFRESISWRTLILNPLICPKHKDPDDLSGRYTAWYAARFPRMTEFAISSFKSQIDLELHRRCVSGASLSELSAPNPIKIDGYATGETDGARTGGQSGRRTEMDIAGDQEQNVDGGGFWSPGVSPVRDLGNYAISVEQFSVRERKEGSSKSFYWTAFVEVRDGLGVDPGNLNPGNPSAKTMLFRQVSPILPKRTAIVARFPISGCGGCCTP
jgi:RHS repeat-associated protein